MKQAAILAGLLCPLCVGCASSLRVWDGNREISGVPFNVAAVFVKEFDRNRHSERGASCTPAHVAVTVSLPLGPRHYANVRPATFAKTGFSMEFGESGLLSGITLNTEPAGADTLRAATEAVTAVAPLVGLADVAPTEDAVPSLPACDMGESNVRFTEFGEWQRSQGR